MSRLAEKKDLNQVVDVHISAFPGFFLTILGKSFLRVMYEAFFLSKGSIFLVEEIDGRIVGFAVGRQCSAAKDTWLAIRFLPRFLIAVLPGLIRNPIKVSRRIFGHIFYEGGKTDLPGGGVMLRSIGVLPKMQGKGVANKLLEAFEKNAYQQGLNIVILTTDAENNDRAIGFYLKNGYLVDRKIKQDDSRFMLLLTKHINN